MLLHACKTNKQHLDSKHFDMFMSAAGRTVLTSQPPLDEVAPGARKSLTQAFEDTYQQLSKLADMVDSGHTLGTPDIEQATDVEQAPEVEKANNIFLNVMCIGAF